MRQLPLPGIPEKTDIAEGPVVNVASVPHRSPFRYPGGKTWLVPKIRRWLLSQPELPSQFIEPFAGGAIVGLTAAFEQLAEHVTLVERDEAVAAVWQSIITNDDAAWLADQIAAFDFTSENVERLLSTPQISLRERALQTIVKNRANRGGILANGAGRIKYGEAGRGIASRWYPDTLRKRIMNIAAIRNRLSFIAGDGFATIRDMMNLPNVAYFIDPPYTASNKKPGNRLYKYSEIDHEALFALLAEVAGELLITYDNDPYVRDLASQFGFVAKAVTMKNTHHETQTELLIGRNLDWLE